MQSLIWDIADIILEEVIWSDNGIPQTFQTHHLVIDKLGKDHYKLLHLETGDIVELAGPRQTLTTRYTKLA